jgi:hypothetical protein
MALGVAGVAANAPRTSADEPVVLSARLDSVAIGGFHLEASEDRIIVRWTTRIEQEILGFHVSRSGDGGPIRRISDLIPGLGQAASYEYEDLDVESGIVYGYALTSIDRTGSSEFFDFTHLTAELVPPVDSTLAVTFVNPVQPPTVFTLFFPRPALATVRVFDITGRQRAFIEMEIPRPGTYAFPWNGVDDDGQTLESGVFFARLVAGDQSLVRKVVVLRR